MAPSEAKASSNAGLKACSTQSLRYPVSQACFSPTQEPNAELQGRVHPKT
ncbi:MAG: hypothetical protein NVS1B11_36170 [Terriglobales bacterium]